MLKRIGFIDFFIDEWHANNYPAWLRASSRFKGFELGYAWEEKTRQGGRGLADWCYENKMIPAVSIEEVVEESDAVFVLAPSNPEIHERLAELPLKSGKPLYIDKPFAPNLETAKRIADMAERYHTPLMSSSALRYGFGFTKAMKDIFYKKRPDFAVTTGGGSNFPEYAVHQIEMIVAALGTGASKIRTTPCGDKLHLEIEYIDGRFAAISY